MIQAARRPHLWDASGLGAATRQRAGTASPVALYWSAWAWRPITMGSVHPGTKRGTLDSRMGSRKTVPPSSFRSVPLGDFHIFFRPNSVTRASSGVIVAHLIPTLCLRMAAAAARVTPALIKGEGVTGRKQQCRRVYRRLWHPGSRYQDHNTGT